MSSSHSAANETNIDNSINTDDTTPFVPTNSGSETSIHSSQESLRDEVTNDNFKSVLQKRQKKRQHQQQSKASHDKSAVDETAPKHKKQRPSVSKSQSHWNDAANEKKVNASIDNITSKLQLIKSKMIIYHVRQIFCLLMIIVMAYATYQQFPAKQLILPEVKPFFAASSFVDDWPAGDLFKTQAKVTLSELSFVLFYAPWSADSQRARETYDFMAKLFYKQAYFAAINCWHPVGECRLQYTKVMSWPVLMAYNQNGVAIPYSGVWSQPALTSFILALLQPLMRIHEPEDLLDLMHNHDVVMVAYLDMVKHQAFYNIYLQAAIKWLERDPHRDVAFAVVSGETRSVFGVDREPSLRLYQWNDTLEYDNNTWKPSLLLQWLSNNMQRVTMWAAPPGTKSTTLRPFVDNGPTLILFTTRNLYERPNDAYAMLRQVAYEYNNCKDDEWIKDLSRVYSHQRRRENHQHAINAKNECKKIFDWEKAQFADCASVARKSFVALVNSSKFNAADQRAKDSYCSIAPSHGRDAQLGNGQSTCPYASQRSADHYVTLQAARNSLRAQVATKISMLNADDDSRSADRITRLWKNLRCKVDQLSNDIRAGMFYDATIEQSSVAVQEDFDVIAGAGCKYNRSITFMAMDSSQYAVFAERLGVDLRRTHERTAAVILDSENESSYVLQEPITTRNLIHFVSEYADSKLNRYLRNNANITHSYFYDNVRPYNVHLSRRSDQQQKPNGHRRSQSIAVREISSHDFDSDLLETSKTVAVLFYSTQCALCTVFTNTLLYAANVLRDLPNLEFVRIDSDKNDLPWQFTMESVPTFIIFNGPNKLESRKFPSNLPINVRNVIGFVLSNLERPIRLQAMVLILKQQKIGSIDDGLASLKREVSDHISYSLQSWRKLPHKRNSILRRIQWLQQLYLATLRIQSVNQLGSLDKLVRNILNLWTGNE